MAFRVSDNNSNEITHLSYLCEVQKETIQICYSVTDILTGHTHAQQHTKEKHRRENEQTRNYKNLTSFPLFYIDVTLKYRSKSIF